MTSMKRKLDNTEDHQGSFHENSIPAVIFPVGEDVFISSTCFNNRFLVHVRRYKKHEGKYYPSKEGITLTPYQFIHLVNSPFLREKSTVKHENNPSYECFIDLPPTIDRVTVYSDTSAGIRDSGNWQNVLLIEFGDTILLKKICTCRSGKTYTTNLRLNDAQWDKIFTIRKSILNNLCYLKYSRINFKKIFESILKCPAPQSAPEEDAALTNTLNYLLQTEIYKLLAHNEDLMNPFGVDPEELSKNTQENFCEAAMNLKPYKIVKSFYDTVKNKTQHPIFQENLLNFVTVPFLESINLVEIFQTARNDFCIHSE